jgi:large subunit ribosomal protein L16
MLSPKKPRFRKQMKMVRHLHGVETRGCQLESGDYGLQALESKWISARHIEAGRMAITRYIKRGGKIWIRIFPDKPLTKKPAETRQGKGKGAPELWVAEVRAGRIMYELTGIPEKTAEAALQRASVKLPVRCRVVKRSDNLI